MNELRLGLIVAGPLRAELLNCLRNIPLHIAMDSPEIGEGVLFQSQLRQFGPDVLLLDITPLGDRFAEVISSIRSLPAPPAIIALHNSAPPETILAAMRAGASEFLYPPFSEQVLRRALDRIAIERTAINQPAAAGMGIGFLSAIGGCGGTTAACHFAAEIARLTERDTLLADMDLVSGMAGFWTKAKSPYSIVDAVRLKHRLDRSLWDGLVSRVQARLDVIAAPAEPVVEEAGALSDFAGILQFSRANYGWVVADLGHGLSPFTAGLLDQFSSLFLVTSLDIPALYQARRVARKLLDSGYGREVVRLVLNRAQSQNALRSEEVARLLGLPVEAVLPEDRQVVEEAHEEGRLVSPRCELRKRIAQMAGRVAGISLGEHEKSRFALFKRFRAPLPSPES